MAHLRLSRLAEAGDRFRSALEQETEPQRRVRLQLRISQVALGVTMLADRDDSVEAMLSRADTALYQAKKSGRDRVTIAETA